MKIHIKYIPLSYKYRYKRKKKKQFKPFLYHWFWCPYTYPAANAHMLWYQGPYELNEMYCPAFCYRECDQNCGYSAPFVSYWATSRGYHLCASPHLMPAWRVSLLRMMRRRKAQPKTYPQSLFWILFGLGSPFCLPVYLLQGQGLVLDCLPPNWCIQLPIRNSFSSTCLNAVRCFLGVS